MPHMFQTIDCNNCDYEYCLMCEDKCPKCGVVDVSDDKTMQFRIQMKKQLSKYHKNYK